MMTGVGFKTCAFCERTWNTRDEFLSDPSLFALGYQADIDAVELGLILFNHSVESCGTTLGVRVGTFLDLYAGPRYQTNRALTAGCPRYCLDSDQLGRCDRHCECAVARDALVLVRARLEAARQSYPALAGATLPKKGDV